MTDRDRSLAFAAALTTVVLWSSAFVGVRAAGQDLSPGPLTLARLLVGALVLGVVVAVRREALPPRADVPRLGLCGLLWFAAYNVLLNAAEQRVDAGTAAMLVNTGVVACLPFGPALVREAGHASAGTVAWTAYIGVFSTAVGFTTWAYALRRTTAGKMGATTYLVPPLAILLGWLLLGEAPPALAFAGGALCLAGVAVTRGARLPRRWTSRRLPA